MSIFFRKERGSGSRSQGEHKSMIGKSNFGDDNQSKEAQRRLKKLLETDVHGANVVGQAFAHFDSASTGKSQPSPSEIDVPIPEGHMSRRLPQSPSLKERQISWDEINEVYDEHKRSGELDPVRNFEWKMAARLLLRVGLENKTIVDLGTGTGLLAQLLNEEPHPALSQYGQIIGIDLSGKLLQKGRGHYGITPPALDENRVHFVQASMADQVLPNHSCDVITAINSLDAVPDDEVRATLVNSFRMLKKDGHMLVLMRHPKRYGYYASQGKERNKEVDKDQEGPYKERWPGAPEGVVAYYRGLDTWGDWLTSPFYAITGKNVMIGHFDIAAAEKTALISKAEADRHPELAQRYLDPITGESRAAGIVFLLEKKIDLEMTDIR